MKYMRARGFTLVELLVVMSIISVLVSVIAGGFRSSQARGRDAQRKSDLKQVANALELYYSDYGRYFNEPLPWGGELTDGKTSYFKVVPTDPSSSLDYYYRIVDPGTNQKYQLFAHLENTEDKDIITTSYSCGGSVCNFSITSTNTTPSE